MYIHVHMIISNNNTDPQKILSRLERPDLCFLYEILESLKPNLSDSFYPIGSWVCFKLHETVIYEFYNEGLRPDYMFFI